MLTEHLKAALVCQVQQVMPLYFSLALTWLGDDGYAERSRYGGIDSETDFREFNGFRYVCEFAGYLRKYRGKFIIGSECQQLLKTGGQSVVYRGLFRNFIIQKFR